MKSFKEWLNEQDLGESSTQTNPRLAFMEYMLDSMRIKGSRKYLDKKADESRLGKYKTTCKVNDSEFQLYADAGIDFKFFRWSKETDVDIINYKTGDFLDKDSNDIFDKVQAFFKQNKVQVDNIRDYTSSDNLRQGFQCSVSIPTVRQSVILSDRGIKGKYLDGKYSNDVYKKYTDSINEDSLNEAKEYTVNEFISEINKTWHKYFPKSPDCATLYNFMNSKSIFVKCLIGDKSVWFNGYEQNDMSNVKFDIEYPYHMIGDNDSLSDSELTLEVEGNSFYIKPIKNEYLAYEKYPLKYRKSRGTADKLLKTLDKYFKMLHDGIKDAESKDWIHRNHLETVQKFVR